MKAFKTIAIAAATVTGIATLGIATLFAAQPSNTGRVNPMSRFVNAIAAKFNLNVADVQAVVDERQQVMRNEQQAKRLEDEQTRLAAAVADGKLTQAQADLITAKHVEIQKAMESIKDLEPEARAEALKAQAESLKVWADENNIPAQYVMMFGFGRGMMGGFGSMGNVDWKGKQNGERGGWMMGDRGLRGGMHGAFGAWGGEKASQQ